jgi:hypothetical protein
MLANHSKNFDCYLGSPAIAGETMVPVQGRTPMTPPRIDSL